MKSTPFLTVNNGAGSEAGARTPSRQQSSPYVGREYSMVSTSGGADIRSRLIEPLRNRTHVSVTS